MSLTVSGYAMVSFEEVCAMLGDTARASRLIGDAVHEVSTSARITVPQPPTHWTAHSADLVVDWRDGAGARHRVGVRLHAVQGGNDPITEVVATLDDELEPAQRATVTRGLHRILDLFTAEVEHPAARVLDLRVRDQIPSTRTS